jgi:pyruvate dehydrogenase E2 component (dihydrolipoamide acetyltransferase)
MTPYQFVLPDIGEGVAQGEVVKWHVKVGDAIKEDQPLVSVLTDKANVEIPSPRTGKVLEIHAAEGAIVKVGGPLVTIETTGGPAPPAHGHGAAAAAPAVAPPAHAPPPPPPAPAAAAGGRVLAPPSVRHRAAQLGIDLSRVSGTGSGGRITDGDLEAFAKGASAAPAAVAHAPPPPPPPGTAPSAAPPPIAPSIPAAPAAPVEVPSGARQERVPIRGLRRVIAERMAIAHARSARFTYVEEIDVTELFRVRERSRKKMEEKGVQLSYLPFVIKAVIQGLKEHPWMNAYFDDARQEVVVCKYYNIGVATAAPDGLLVPVIKDADRKSLGAIAREIQDLAERGRAGKLTREELTGSTFTITSLGALGGVLATPIVNYPEVAILGVHKIVKRPVYATDGTLVPAYLMNLSVSLDHRVLDGIVGAQFLSVVKSHLEDPHQLFLEMA